MKFNPFRMEFDSVLHMLRDYQLEMESQLVRMQKEAEDRNEAFLKNIQDEEELNAEESILRDE